MPGITGSTANSNATTAERPTRWLNPTRTASRSAAGAADAGRPRAPEAAKAAGRESDSDRSDGGSAVGRASAGTDGLVISARPGLRRRRSHRAIVADSPRRHRGDALLQTDLEHQPPTMQDWISHTIEYITLCPDLPVPQN